MNRNTEILGTIEAKRIPVLPFELEVAIQDLGPEFYDVFNQSSETWHDNAPFDALRDRQSVLFAELQNLKSIMKNAAISIPKQKKGVVGIGSKVTVENIDLQKTHTYLFAGDWTYRTGEQFEDAIIISAEAPLAKAIAGKKVGETATFRHSLLIREIEHLPLI